MPPAKRRSSRRTASVASSSRSTGSRPATASTRSGCCDPTSRGSSRSARPKAGATSSYPTGSISRRTRSSTCPSNRSTATPPTAARASSAASWPEPLPPSSWWRLQAYPHASPALRRRRTGRLSDPGRQAGSQSAVPGSDLTFLVSEGRLAPHLHGPLCEESLTSPPDYFGERVTVFATPVGTPAALRSRTLPMPRSSDAKAAPFGRGRDGRRRLWTRTTSHHLAVGR